MPTPAVSEADQIVRADLGGMISELPIIVRRTTASNCVARGLRAASRKQIELLLDESLDKRLAQSASPRARPRHRRLSTDD